MAEQTSNGSGGLAEELRKVVQQAEALLGALGDDEHGPLGALRGRVHDSLDAAKTRLADLEQQANRASQRAASAAETWVRDNPWTAAALFAALGLIVGTLLARRGPASPPSSGPESP